MDMVDYTDGHGGLHRWTWWTTQMDMVDYRDGHGGLHRWTWWTTQKSTISTSVVHHVDLGSPPSPSV
jgi:hypothetical protein